MERLRARAHHAKTFPELSKQVRSTLLERRTLLDQEDKAVLRRCLDKLSGAIPVQGTASMADRLEAIARKTTGKVKFHGSYGSYILSTEMFYVEIVVGEDNKVKDAKIHHIDPSPQNGGGGPSGAQPSSQVSRLLKPATLPFIATVN